MFNPRNHRLHRGIALVITLFGACLSGAQASTVSLASSVTLSNVLADSASNFHPQGIGYDASANELLFMQQSTGAIFRTDLAGNIVGSRTINNTPSPYGNLGVPNHTVSVAADATHYYYSDYTCNSSCFDLMKVDKATGTAVSISSEVSAYGGYPIDVRNGVIYRTNASTTYDYTMLHQIRAASTASPDVITSTRTLTGAGIADFAVDDVNNSIWVLDYLASASIRRFDLTTGALLESFALGLDGLDAGLTYANGKLYYYDWKSNSGSTLTTYNLQGYGNPVPAPGTLALLGLGLAGLGFSRRRG